MSCKDRKCDSSVHVTITNLKIAPRSGSSVDWAQLRGGFDHGKSCQFFSGLSRQPEYCTDITITVKYIVTCMYMQKNIYYTCDPLSHDRCVWLYCASEQHRCWYIFSPPWFCHKVVVLKKKKVNVTICTFRFVHSCLLSADSWDKQKHIPNWKLEGAIIIALQHGSGKNDDNKAVWFS